MRSALALVVLAAACSSSPVVQSRRAEKADLVVTRGTIEDRVLLTGELAPADSVEIGVPRTSSWQLSVRWIADHGSDVSEGDRLLEFDNSQVAEQLRELELGVSRAANELVSQQAKASLDIANKELEVERQRIEVAKAKLDADIPQRLVPRRQWQENQLKLERARAAHQTAVDALESARRAAAHEERVRRIEYEKAQRNHEEAREQIEALVLRAPRDGVLLVAEHPWFGRRLQVGDMVRPGFSAVEVSSGSEMVVEAGLSDVDDGRVEEGMAARCVLDAYPDRVFAGEIASVSEIARPPNERSTRRFFEVTIELETTDTEVMRPGLSVRVDIDRRAEQDAVIAPRAGLAFGGDEPRARLAGGGERPVEIELCNAQACAVADGLEPGQRLRRASTEVP